MTKEVLKLALEALEEAWYHVGTFQPTEKAIDLYDEARAAIKEALREHAMREVQRLGQEIEQEPVAWLTDDEREAFERFNETCEDGEGYDVPKTMMRRLAEIGVIHHTSRGIYGITKFGLSLVGYTTPPQRTWVGLTEDDWDDIFGDAMTIGEAIKATEAKLKELNT